MRETARCGPRRGRQVQARTFACRVNLRLAVPCCRLDFLPHHFLLVSTGAAGVLTYQDTSTGQIVAQHRTRLGPCDVLRQNPHNAVMCLGHSNGTVTMWTPNMTSPVVRMLCHKVPAKGASLQGWAACPIAHVKMGRPMHPATLPFHVSPSSHVPPHPLRPHRAPSAHLPSTPGVTTWSLRASTARSRSGTCAPTRRSTPTSPLPPPTASTCRSGESAVERGRVGLRLKRVGLSLPLFHQLSVPINGSNTFYDTNSAK